MLKLLVKIILLIAVAIVAWPITSEAEVFQNVDQKTWECMKADSERVHRTIYTSEYPEPGRSTTGLYVLDYKFDASKNTVEYTIVNSGGILTPSTFWNGIHGSIAACKK